ncbi:MAG: JAB domain-containing protein [Ruminococcus sp.]
MVRLSYRIKTGRILTMITYEYKTFIDKQQRTYLKEVRKLEIEKNLVTPKEVNDFFCDQYHIQENAEEYLYIVAVNAAMQPIGVFEISHGSAHRSLLNVREIFVKLFLCGAVGFFLVHNHPSQNTEPSEMDRIYTHQMEKAAKLMEIEFLDHIIIGNGYYSFREQKQLLLSQREPV